MPYCIYLRKSRADTEAEQRGEGETLARHEKALTSFAKQSELEVTAIYREIISGETIAARPQMQKLLSEVSQGLWDGVIVMDVDRLARGNSIDQGIISQTFLYANTKIITPTKTYDPANEFDEEYFEFGLFMSRREYKAINRRLQRGRTASIREGKYVSNKPPYGYERVRLKNNKGFTLAIVPEKAEIVRNIFQWYTQGIRQSDGTYKRLGTSLIARELNSRHLISSQGNVWTAQTIRDMLINPTYIGKLRWNWRPMKKRMVNGQVITERPRNNDLLLTDGMHESIIDEITFRTAGELMAKNKKRPVRGDQAVQNPLSGLVICQKCGRTMQRRPDTKNPALLICAAPTCDNHASYLHLVEQRILETVSHWSEGYLLKYHSETNLADASILQAEMTALQKTEEKLNRQLSKVFEAFETGIYDAAAFQTRHSVLKEQIEEIRQKQQNLQQSVDKNTESQMILSQLIPKIQSVASSYSQAASIQEKNNLLREIIHHIDYLKEVKGHGHEEEFIIIVHPNLPRLSSLPTT